MQLDLEQHREMLIYAIMEAPFKGKEAIEVITLVKALQQASVRTVPQAVEPQSIPPQTPERAPFKSRIKPKRVI